MQERKGTPKGCLEDETLAAFVDGGLTADERSRVELHLAACQDCFAVFTETVKTVQAMREAGEFDQPVPAELAQHAVPTVVPIAASRRRLVRWAAAGAGLAAAAAVALAVWWPRAERPELVNLVAAVGERRPVEGRLTGGFKFGPIESPTRGAEASTDWRVRAAAGKLAEEARGTQDARLLGALGTARLVTRDFDAAVKYFDRAITRAPDDGLLRSDRAAALLARGDAHGNEDDYRDALMDADASLVKQAVLKEALFNRAIALQRLSRADEERRAWESYLAVDPSSEWAAVARQRLRELKS